MNHDKKDSNDEHNTQLSRIRSPISLGTGRYAAVFCLETQAQHNVFVHIHMHLSIIAMSYGQPFGSLITIIPKRMTPLESLYRPMHGVILIQQHFIPTAAALCQPPKPQNTNDARICWHHWNILYLNALLLLPY